MQLNLGYLVWAVSFSASFVPAKSFIHWQHRLNNLFRISELVLLYAVVFCVHIMDHTPMNGYLFLIGHEHSVVG